MHPDLKHTIKELRRIKKAEEWLEELNQQRNKDVKRLNALDVVIRRKQDRIDKLHSTSFLSIYQQLTGSLQETINLSESQYTELALEYSELVKSIEQTEYEIGILEEQVAKYDELRDELNEQLLSRDTEILTTGLGKYRQVVKEIDFKLGLIKELEEAVDQGVILNRKFNAAIKFITDLPVSNRSRNYKPVKSNGIVVNGVDKYQDYLVVIHHNMVKFEAEVNDVYNHMINDNQNLFDNASSFMKGYRKSLIDDSKTSRSLNRSLGFLQKHKSTAMSLTRNLRSDLKKLKVDLAKLEIQEQQILEDI